jgi:hypothetical protein
MRSDRALGARLPAPPRAQRGSPDPADSASAVSSRLLHSHESHALPLIAERIPDSPHRPRQPIQLQKLAVRIRPAEK